MAQLPLSFPAAPSYAPDDFLVSDANRDAYDQLAKPAHWSAYGLRLVGPRGSGRTHLAHLWATRQNARFASLPVTQVQGDLVLDDITASTDEKALFHLLNLTQAANHKLLLVCDEMPLAEMFRLPDLLSRLNALPLVRLQQPDDALLAAVLRKQMADRQLRVPEDVLTYILPRTERSFFAIRQVAQALDEEALLRHREITVGLAREVLARLKA